METNANIGENEDGGGVDAGGGVGGGGERDQGWVALRAIQLNCARMASVSSALAMYMLENGIQIAMLQEHHTNKRTGDPSGFPRGMRAYSNAGGGQEDMAAIIVNDPNIEVVPVKELINKWGTCVWLKGNFGEVIVCSMYCRGRIDLEPYVQYIESVIRVAQDRPLLLGADANARSPMWHSKVHINARGDFIYGYRARALEEVIARQDLNVLNRRSEWYTFVGERGSSDIDVTIATQALVRKFDVTWEVCPGVAQSDHNALRIVLRTHTAPEITRHAPHRWNTRSADWVAFRETLIANTTGKMIEDLSAELMEQELERIVNNACEESFRKEEPAKTRRPTWWTEDLHRMRQSLRRARLQYQKGRRTSSTVTSEELLRLKDLHRSLVRSYSKNIQAQKALDWQRFVTDNGNSNPWGAVYKICRSKGNTSIAQMRTPDGHTTTWAEAAVVLLRKFVPARSDEEHETVVETTERSEHLLITPAEVKNAIRRCNVKRAPGLDGKRADIIRNVFAAIPELIVTLFNKCLREGVFPVAWKQGHVLPFLKAADKDQTDPGSYRPITLLPIMGKVMERILVDRLKEQLPPQSERQYGFTAGRSTVDAWMHVKDIMTSSQTKYVAGVFVDFKGAFDHINWTAIISKLREVGCMEMGIWRSYFSNRRSCMIGRQDVVWTEVQRGCPQGSICGPTMWNILMNGLLVELENSGVKHAAYADDLLLIVEGNSRIGIEQSAMAAVQYAVQWGARVGVEVSFKKTEALMLHGNFNIARMPIILAQGERIRFVRRLKYLGIWVSEGFRFESHLREIGIKLAKVLVPLKRVLKNQWGLKRKATNTWVKGLLTPIVMYGSPVWYHTVQKTTGAQVIASIQRSVLYACLRVCRTVSTEAMQVLMNQTPWDLEAIRHAVRYKIRKGLSMKTGDLLTDAEAEHRGFEVLDGKVKECWQNRWNTSEKGRVTHQFIGVVGLLSAVSFDPPTSAGFLLTGHGSLNSFLHQRNIEDVESSCRCGSQNEDWKHVLAECPMYADLRNLSEMGISDVDGKLDVTGVLANKRTYDAFSTYAIAAFRRRRERSREDETNED